VARFTIPTVEPVLRGDYERIRFDLMQAKELPTDPDTPQNISGWTLRFSAKFDLSDATPIVTKSSDVPGDFEILDATAGSGYIILQPSDLAGMTYETTLICDLQATDIEDKPFSTRFYLPVELDVST
jgi:hypothetical protein